jgi:hypothetical protein
MKGSLTYGETRKIGIGDYESSDVFLSFTLEVSKINGKNIASIHEHESMDLEEFNGDVQETYKKIRSFVKKKLDAKETAIRKWASTWTGDYPLEKIEDMP